MSSHRSGRQRVRDLRSLNERINEDVTLALAESKAKRDKKKTTFEAKCTEDEVVAKAVALDEDEVPLPIETEDEDSTSNDARWFEMCTEDEIKKDEKSWNYQLQLL